MVFDRTSSKKRKLTWVFLSLSARLIRKSDDVFILPVRKGKNVDMSTLWQVRLNASGIGVELFFATAKTKIIGKLAHFKSLVE